MGTLAAYSFIGGAALMVGWLAYRTCIASGNRARFNRMVLLGIYAFSLALFPIMQIDFHVNDGVPEALTVDMVEATETPVFDYDMQTGTGAIHIMLLIYMFGASAAFLLSVITALRIALTVLKAERKDDDGISVAVMSDARIAPFSWGRTVVMSERDYNGSHSMIITHEKAHIEACHFLDLILAQAVCVLMWYNPAAWLMLRELKRVHEYEADAAVLASGYDARDYQMLLVEKAAGMRFALLSDSFNSSGLRDRIVHMLKPGSGSRRTRGRVAVLLPVGVVLIYALNLAPVSQALSRVESTTLVQTKVNGLAIILDDKDFHGNLKDINSSDIKRITVDRNANSIRISTKDDDEPAVISVPEYEGGLKELQRWISGQLNHAASERKRVVVQMTITTAGKAVNPVIIRSAGEEADAEVIRVINEMPAVWIPAKLSDGTPVDAPFTLPVNLPVR